MNRDAEIWPRVETALRGLVPVTLTTMLVVLSSLPLGVPMLGSVMPLLPLMAVYYWAVHRPDLMPYAASALIGLFQDILSGMPLGMSALIYVSVHAVVVNQGRFFHGKSFVVIWFGFAVLAVGGAFLGWLIASAYYQTLAAPAPALFQLLLTMALYPALSSLFGLVQRELLRPA